MFKHLAVYLLAAVLLLGGIPGPQGADLPAGRDNTAICILLGVSAGLAFASGNLTALVGTMIGAHSKGCF